VSGRAGVRCEGSSPSELTCRCGGRHPGLRKGRALRGVPSKRRSWSVRALSWVPPARESAPATADVRRAPRRGTRSRMRPKRMHPSHARVIVACPGRRVLRSVLRPVLVNPHSTCKRATVCVVRRSSRHHGWANPRKWEEPALGSDERTWRGSPRVTVLARERA